MLHYQKKNLTVFQSSLYKTTSAVIKGKEALIITDPTWLPVEIEDIRRYVTKHLGEKQLYIIYTHSDFDHIIGAAEFPEATVIASEEFKMNSNKEKILKEIYDFDQEYYIERNHVPYYPTVDKVIKDDGETLSLGDLTLTFYKAPGHTDDGLFTIIEPDGIFLSGDYLSDVEFPFIESSYLDYINTVDKALWIMKQHDLKLHIPGHGSVTDEKEQIFNRIHFSKEYLKRLKEDGHMLEKELNDKFQFFDGMIDSHIKNIERAEKEGSDRRSQDSM